jgi:hemoglobin/transferrin/lactoferrin receptor protein
MKSNFGHRAIAFTCSLIAISSSQAAIAAGEAEEAIEDEAIVVSATRTPVEIEDAPATVTVIDGEQIADELVTDIKDLVRFEPGITVRRAPARFGAALGSTGRAGNEDFNIRGIGGNRVLIQVDGIRSPQGFNFGAQDAGRGGYTDVGLVKSVEILRGPASALYGSDGLSGVISFVTSDPNDLIDEGNSFGGFARAQYSSADEEFAETAAIAGQFGDFSAMLAYTRRDFKELGNQGTDDVTGLLRTTPNPQNGESNAILGKLVWENGGHRIRLTGEYLDREVNSNILSGLGDVSFGPGFTVWSVDRLEANDTTERKRFSLDYTWHGEGIIDYAHIAAYWQDGEDRQFTAEDRTPILSPAPDRTRINIFENKVYGGVAELRSDFSTGSIKHRLSFGGDVSWTEQAGTRDGTVPPTGETFPTRPFPVTDFTLGGLYLADEISFADGLVTIFPALRFDFYDLDPNNDPLLPATFATSGQDGSRLSPKIGVTIKPTDTVRVYGSYSQGFRAPTPSQVNQFFENLTSPFGAYRTEPNPDLGPETSESFEIGARYVDDRFSIGITGFFASFDDFISQETVAGSGSIADPFIFQNINIDSVDVHGVEAKLSYQHENGLRIRFAAAYADGDQTTGGVDGPLSTIEPLNAVLGVGYRDPDNRFGGELITSYNGRKSLGETAGVCTATCFRPETSIIFDATAFFRIAEHFTLRAGIFNITDKSYAYWSDVRGLNDTSAVTDAYTRPGRNVSVSISASF